MTQVLTREEMIQRMLAVAARSQALIKIASETHLAQKDEILQKGEITEEAYDRIGLAYLMGFGHANDPWMELIRLFQAMPLYHQRDEKD